MKLMATQAVAHLHHHHLPYHNRRRVHPPPPTRVKKDNDGRRRRVNERRVNQTFWAGGQLSSSRIKTHKTFRKSTRRNTHRKITQEMKKRFIKKWKKRKTRENVWGSRPSRTIPAFSSSPVSPDSSSRVCLVLSRPSNYLSCNHQQQSSKETLTTIPSTLKRNIFHLAVCVINSVI